MPNRVDKARCVHCRTDIAVPESYAHGDHVKCGTCGTQHRVMRGDVLRLVIADAAPLKEELRAHEQRIGSLEDELRGARASIGIGVNGIGIGVAYFFYQVVFGEATWSRELLFKAVGVALGSGLLLEVCNYLFMAKRRRISQLSEEIAMLRAEGRTLQQKIREAGRR
jgi:hypothetical protein